MCPSQSHDVSMHTWLYRRTLWSCSRTRLVSFTMSQLRCSSVLSGGRNSWTFPKWRNDTTARTPPTNLWVVFVCHCVNVSWPSEVSMSVCHHQLTEWSVCVTISWPNEVSVSPSVGWVKYLYHHQLTEWSVCITISWLSEVSVSPSVDQMKYLYHHQLAEWSICVTVPTEWNISVIVSPSVDRVKYLCHCVIISWQNEVSMSLCHHQLTEWSTVEPRFMVTPVIQSPCHYGHPGTVLNDFHSKR